MDTFLRDLRYGFRSLFRAPSFTLPALIILALGIGATTAIFSLIYPVLLRPLPFPNPDELVVVLRKDPSWDRAFRQFSYLDYLDLRERSKAFQEMGASGSTMPR